MLIGNTANSLRHSHRNGIDKYTLLANQTARKALPTVSGSGISWAVCTWLQTDNHANTPPLIFCIGRMPFLPPNHQRQSTDGTTDRHSIND